MKLNCLITGVGGQGTVLLSRLIGAAAINRGMDVRGSETIGMAQRGGSVVSHLRLGQNIHSPLIPPGKADVIIAFECAEAVRVLPFLAPAGRMMVLDRWVPPVTSLLAKPQSAGDRPWDPRAMIAYLETLAGTVGGETSNEPLTVINGDSLIKRCGSAKVINVALLGAALTKGLLPFNAEEIAAVLRERLPPKYLEMNLKALEIGLNFLD
jgi:indolepyruvate ferredoxin oxidoreductase beta subunit